MPLYYNGTRVLTLTYNDTNITELTYKDTTVFKNTTINGVLNTGTISVVDDSHNVYAKATTYTVPSGSEIVSSTFTGGAAAYCTAYISGTTLHVAVGSLLKSRNVKYTIVYNT